MFGPLGNGYAVNESANNILLIAGGMGIAPMRFLAESAAAAGKQVTILQGARTCDLLVPITIPQILLIKASSRLPSSALTPPRTAAKALKGWRHSSSPIT